MTGRHGRPEPHPGEPTSGGIEGTDVPLGPLTTLRVGGPAARIIEPQGEPQLLQSVLGVWDSGDDWLVLGGGSNVVISDDGFEGTVIRVATRGVARIVAPGGTVRLRVQAGEPWDDLVAYTVEQGWSGLEALSGIPGSTGASPIQNIGAYGQEAGDAIVSVDFLDYGTGRVERLARDELELGYRTSVFKRGKRGVVLSVTFSLTDASAQAGALGDRGADTPGALALGDPIAYPQLASALGVAMGDRVALGGVRAAVLRLRASKGMVLDATDPDSVSAGSFFTNPIVSENFARGLPSDAPRWLVEPEAEPTVVPLPDPASGLTVDLTGPLEASGAPAEPKVKLSAAWLIERVGIGKGFALPGSRAAISSKHTLAIVNTGGATAAEISELSRYIQNRVSSEFGVRLHPEPVFVGLS